MSDRERMRAEERERGLWRARALYEEARRALSDPEMGQPVRDEWEEAQFAAAVAVWMFQNERWENAGNCLSFALLKKFKAIQNALDFGRKFQKGNKYPRKKPD